jgi:NAD(P)-dependent dehydrogenase (short-subunit alcohol dehydrogenase family)
MNEHRKVALVTGASRGLGLVVAGLLARRDVAVVMNARDDAALRRAAETLATKGTTLVTLAGDITEAAVRGQLIAAARELGGLDILVNNASELGPIGPLTALDVTHLGRIFPVNVGAPLALIQLAVPLLTARRGLIVNVTSDAAVGAYPGWGPYGASKAALELITRTLAAELHGQHVSAIVVDPGDMRTAMHQAAFPDEDISDRPLPDVTLPFWNWLFDQDPMQICGQRFCAQQEEASWLQGA